MFGLTRSQKMRDPRTLCIERKLSLALRASTVEAFFERYKNRCLTLQDQILLKHVPGVDTYRRNSTSVAEIMRDILGGNFTVLKETKDLYQRMVTTSYRTLSLQFEYLLQHYECEDKNSILRNFQEYKSKESNIRVLLGLIEAIGVLNNVINKLTPPNLAKDRGKTEEENIKSKAQTMRYISSPHKLEFYWNGKLCLIHYKSSRWILPQLSIQQLHNKLCDCLSVLLLVGREKGVSLEPEAEKLTINFISSLCTFHIRHENRYFDMAGSLEGLCTGIILTRVDEWDNDTLLRTLIEEVQKDTGTNLHHSILLDILKRCSTPLVAELSCLAKITGHPLVDIKLGTNRLYTRATEELEINYDAVVFSACAIKESFIATFYHKHGRWPAAHILTTECHPALLNAWARNKSPRSNEIVREFGECKTLDYKNIELGKELEFKTLENMIPYLQDKTICAIRSKVINAWLGNTKIEQKDKRLLLHYLTSKELDIDHRKTLNAYIQSGVEMEDLLDYLVIRIVPKEKELKVKYRGFGCMTYQSRCRMLAQEKSAMFYLDLYHDEQAMTLSEFQMANRLFSFRRMDQSYSAHRVFHVCCDASGWCGRWRHDAVHYPMTETLDKIFDCPIFSKTHLAYQNTLYFIEDELYGEAWEGQLGGIEGLSQDTWVILYTAQMRYALRDTGYKFHILCKGDDLRIAVAVPESELKGVDLKEFSLNLNQRLSDAAAKFGHQLKVRESYVSGRFMSFSKQYSIDRIELSSQFRKIQKCYGSNNAILPTLDDYTGSTYANAHASAYAGVTHLSCFYVALMWSTYYLLTSLEYKKLAIHEHCTLLCTPSVLGEFPVIFLHNMFVRAESDLLTAYLDIYLFSKTYDPDISLAMKNMIEQPMIKKTSRNLLALDPFGLALTKPTNVKSYLKKKLRVVLERITKNENIKQLLTSYNDHQKAVFLDGLTSSSDVIQARVIAAVYAASPFSIIDELCASFDSARSIWVTLLQGFKRRYAFSVLRSSIALDYRIQCWRINTLKGKYISHDRFRLTNSILCPLKIASDMREFCYNIRVITVNNPPMSHYMYYKTPEDLSVMTTTYDQDNHFTYHRINTEDESCVTRCDRLPHSDHYLAGRRTPFLGHKTSTGVQEPEIHFVDKDPIVKKIKDCLMLIGWTQQDDGILRSNLPLVIKNMMKSFTSLSYDQLSPFAAKRRSGTATHHLRTPSFKESIVPNNRSNLLTHFWGESNTHRTFRDLQEKRTINYLQIYVHSLSIFSIGLEVSSKHEPKHLLWGITSDCKYCNSPIYEPPIVLRKPEITHMTFPAIKSLQVGKAAEISLQRIMQEFEEKRVEYHEGFEGDENLGLDDAYGGILNIFFSQCMRYVQSIVDRHGIYKLGPDSLEVFNHMCSEGRHKVVSITELKKIPAREILEGLVPYIIAYFTRLFSTTTPGMIPILIMTSPPGSLPWHFPLTILLRAGVLPDLVHACQVKYGGTPPLCYTNELVLFCFAVLPGFIPHKVFINIYQSSAPFSDV